MNGTDDFDFDFDDVATRAGDEARVLRVPSAPAGEPQRRRRVRRAQRTGAATTVVVLAIGAVVVLARCGGSSRRNLHVAGTSTSVATTSTSVASVATTSTTPTTPTTTNTVPPPPFTLPGATAFPTLVVADGSLERVTPNERTTISGPADVRVAFALPDGSYVAQRGDGDASRISRWTSDGSRSDFRDLDGEALIGVGSYRHRNVLLVEDANADGQEIVVYDARSRAKQGGGAGSGPGYGINRASIAGDHLLVDPQTPRAAYLELRALSDPTGPTERIAAPTGDLGTRGYSLGVVSPDGTKVAFVDTAPWDSEQPDVVVRSTGSGRELLRTTLPRGETPPFLDYDGRYIVVSANSPGWPPLVLDTDEATPTWRQVTGVTGTVTIDRA